MDKSFNDQELSDIMKEIEALEDDFTTQGKPSLASDHEVVSKLEEKEFFPEPSDEIKELFEEAQSKLNTAAIVQNESNVMPLESVKPTPKTTSSQTSMSFNIQGSLTLDLQFNISGKTVSLEVTESGLAIEMEGGIRFTVPVGEKSPFKKAV